MKLITQEQINTIVAQIQKFPAQDVWDSLQILVNLPNEDQKTADNATKVETKKK